MAMVNQPIPSNAVASLEGGGQGRGGRILFNYVNQPRKKLIIKLNILFYFSNILPLNRHRNNA
jgi:hypothetical protein